MILCKSYKQPHWLTAWRAFAFTNAWFIRKVLYCFVQYSIHKALVFGKTAIEFCFHFTTVFIHSTVKLCGVVHARPKNFLLHVIWPNVHLLVSQWFKWLLERVLFLSYFFSFSFSLSFTFVRDCSHHQWHYTNLKPETIVQIGRYAHSSGDRLLLSFNICSIYFWTFSLNNAVSRVCGLQSLATAKP